MSHLLSNRCSSSFHCLAPHRFRVPPKCFVADAASEVSNDQQARYVTYIHRTVGVKERVESAGSVIVHGDVEGRIHAAGDVMVWGKLAGRVHAGCDGDAGATISALELRGAHITIANVTSLAAARVTVPGPHTARVAGIGPRGKLVMQLLPVGAAHPPASSAGIARSLLRWLMWYPAATAALFTGLYALIAGLALLLAPKGTLGILFDASAVPHGWIRLGGVLFATFGMQYLGTALADWRLAYSCSSSSHGMPGMPFQRAGHETSPVSSLDSGEPQQQQQQQQKVQVETATVQQAVTAAPGVLGGSSSSCSNSPAASADEVQHQQQQQQQHQTNISSVTAAAAAAASHSQPPASWLYSSQGFYEASVWSRLVLAAAFCGLVALGHCQRGLLVLAVLNFMGAMGMLQALKKQWMIHVMGDLPYQPLQLG